MEAASASATTSAASSVDGRGGGGSGDYLNLGMFGGGQAAGSSSGIGGPGGVGDLLLGAAGFGGALGNGFGNSDGTNAVGASGVSGSSAFDLSDFPSLGGNSGLNINGIGGPPQVVGNAGNGLAAALRQQQQLLQHQQMLQGTTINNINNNNIISNQNSLNKTSNLYREAMTAGATPGSNFNMATEDFPALPGAPPAGSIAASNGVPNASSLLLGGNNVRSVSVGGGGPFGGGSVSRASSSGSVGGLYSGSNELENSGVGSQLDGSGGLLGGAGIGGLGVLGGLQQPSSLSVGQPRSSSSTSPNNAPGTVGSSANSAVGAGSAAGTALSGDYGLLGLLGVIRMTDADRNSLALGSDLTLLGLSLGSSDQIYQTFSSPWTESVSSKEPHYQLPMCYYMQPPALKTGHLSKFQLETLFYIFYALPKDVLQAYAAQELYTREWRYHADNKLWFKRAAPTDGVPASSSGAPQYLYFDINSWERRLFNGSMNQNFTSSFLAEDDVRVKFSNQ